MTLDAFVTSHGCTLVRLIVNDPFIDPKYEVLAPAHQCFGTGLHSLICFDATDARTRLAQSISSLEDCAADCDCRGEA